MKLQELCSIIRSKNSGPYLLTIDLFANNQENFQWIKDSNVINNKLICDLYKINEDQIEGIYFFDEVLGVKITIQREISSGTFGDVDVYGTQQYIPLLNVEVTK